MKCFHFRTFHVTTCSFCFIVCQSSESFYLSQKAFVFGEQTTAVLHGNIQSPSVQLHEGNRELKPDTQRDEEHDTVHSQLSH